MSFYVEPDTGVGSFGKLLAVGAFFFALSAVVPDIEHKPQGRPDWCDRPSATETTWGCQPGDYR